MMLKQCLEGDGVWGTASNFPAFCKAINTYFPDPKLVDGVKYEDMILRDTDGTRLFDSLKSLKQIRYYVGKK